MKKRPNAGGGDQEKENEGKKRPGEEFRLPETRDLAEARGYVYAGLDKTGTVLKNLITEFQFGSDTVTILGETIYESIGGLVNDDTFDASWKVYYSVMDSDILIDPPNTRLREPMFFEIDTIAKLRARFFNNRPVVRKTEEYQNDDDDNNAPVVQQPVVEVHREVNKFDLMVLWRSLKDRSAEQNEIDEEVKKYVAGFHLSTEIFYGERETYKFDRQNIWVAIAEKLDAILAASIIDASDNAPIANAPIYVYFDAITGTLFASLSLEDRSETTLLLFSTVDIFDTIFGLEATVPQAAAKFGFYKQAVARLRDNREGSLLYQREPLLEKLREKYRPLRYDVALNSWALLFYDDVCEFAFEILSPSVDIVEHQRFHEKIEKASRYAIVFKETYKAKFAEMWPTESMVQPERYRVQQQRKVDEALHAKIGRYSLGEGASNPLDKDSLSIWNNNTEYAKRLQKSVSEQMVGFFSAPQTIAAEILWIGMIVYRNFVEYRVRYTRTIEAYRLFAVTHGSISEQLIDYAARLQSLDDEAQDDTTIARQYEAFMQHCLDFAQDEAYWVATSNAWESLFSVNQKFMLGASPRQAELAFLMRKFIAPFGRDDELTMEEAIRLLSWRYLESCFGVNDGDKRVDLRANASKHEETLNTLVHRSMKQYFSVANTASPEFNILSGDCDIELFDDTLFDEELGNIDDWRIDDTPLKQFVDEQVAAGAQRYILIDKQTRRITMHAFEGGPIELREQIELFGHNSVLLYSPVTPHRRIRTILAPLVLRPQPINVQMALDDDNENGDEERRRAEEEAERRRQRDLQGPGSFRDGNHEHQGLVMEAKKNLYPAQHAVTAWREMMLLALTVYRTFVQFPRAENQIGERSQFLRWTRFLQQNLDRNYVANDRLLDFVRVAQKRLLQLVSIFDETPQVAYDRFLDEILSEAAKKADEDRLFYTSEYVTNTTKLYEVDRGPLTKTLEFLYERNYAILGQPSQQYARFTDALNRYTDRSDVTDAMLESEILNEYKNNIGVEHKDVVLLFVDTENNRILDEIGVIKEMLEKFGVQAPLYFDGSPLLDVALRATTSLLARDREKYTLFARIEPLNRRGVYSLGALPQSYSAKSGRPFTIKFTNGSTLEYPFSVDERNIKLVLKT